MRQPIVFAGKAGRSLSAYVRWFPLFTNFTLDVGCVTTIQLVISEPELARDRCGLFLPRATRHCALPTIGSSNLRGREPFACHSPKRLHLPKPFSRGQVVHPGPRTRKTCLRSGHNSSIAIPPTQSHVLQKRTRILRQGSVIDELFSHRHFIWRTI